MAFCPQAVEWGSIADWLAVVAALIAVVATVVIGKAAGTLAAAANRIADESHRARMQGERRERQQIALQLRDELLTAHAFVRMGLLHLQGEEEQELFETQKEYRQIVCAGLIGWKPSSLVDDVSSLAKLPSKTALGVRDALYEVGRAQRSADEVTNQRKDAQHAATDYKLILSSFKLTATRLQDAAQALEQVVREE